MTHKSDDYNKLDRAHARGRSILNWVDSARDFNLLKYADTASIVAMTREGQKIEISLSGNLKNSIVLAGVQHCTNAAKTIRAEKPEEIDIDKAASI